MPDPFRARPRVDTSTLSPQAAQSVEQRTPANDASVAPDSPPEHPGDRDPSGRDDTPRGGGTSQDIDTTTSGQGTARADTEVTERPQSPSSSSSDGDPQPRAKSRRKGR